MAQAPLRLLFQGLRRLTDRSGGGLTDAQLLERYVNSRDEAAFEVLVWRHGPMVLGLCRRLLRHEADVEDAFQATFLALVRKAQSISKRDAVASWLYKVAYRIVLAARASAANRTTNELDLVEAPAAGASDELDWRDLQPVLDQEVMGLPEKYRTPFVLCCLEGRTNEEAARQLGCPKGTVLSRLARARQRLRERLTRRGLALSAVALALTLMDKAAAAVPASLASKTLLMLTSAVPAVVSARVSALTEGVLHAMFMTKLKTMTAAALLVAAMLGASAGLILQAQATATDSLPRVGAVGQEPPTVQALPQPPQSAGKQQTDDRPPSDDPVTAARRRAQSQNNLKHIGLALHNYHDVYKALPSPAIYSRDGKALLSWRVAVLPYLDEGNLFRQFKLDEAWDSAHNKKLLDAMPKVYAPVVPTKEKNVTYYQAFVGKSAAFEPRKTMRLPANFPDGASDTIIVVEAGEPAPWTKPEDLPFVPDQALPKLGGLFKGHFHALFVDGSVHLISKNADAAALRTAITRDGGEVVEFEKIHAPVNRAGRVDLDLLPMENKRLQDALQAAADQITVAKRDLDALRARLKMPAADDPKTAKLLEENARLRQALTRALAELDALRAETAQLEAELRQQRRENKD